MRDLVPGFHGMATYGSLRAFFQQPAADNGIPMKPIALASDHAGYDLKTVLAGALEAAGHAVLDLGTDGPGSVDYPDYGDALAAAISDGRAERGVAVCGTGIGISIALNRHPGVRAALCHDETSARLAREHNDANVLALGQRRILRLSKNWRRGRPPA